MAAAVYTFAASDRDWRVALIGMLPGVASWGLDAYFLRRERMYRKLHDDVRCDLAESYSMDYRPTRRPFL